MNPHQNSHIDPQFSLFHLYLPQIRQVTVTELHNTIPRYLQGEYLRVCTVSIVSTEFPAIGVTPVQVSHAGQSFCEFFRIFQL